MVALTTRTQYIMARVKNSWMARFKKEAVILLIILGTIMVTRLPRLYGPIDITWDGGVYYILGTSLAEGKGYRLLNEPGEIEAIQYPPLLPLIVAAHQCLLGTNNLLVVGPWLRIFYFFLSICLIIAVYLLARLYLQPEFALLAALMCALYFYIYYWADTLYTEIPFCLTTVLFVLCNRRWDRTPYGIAACVLAMASYLLRTSGIALLIAWVAESLLRGRYRQALIRTGAALVPVILWQGHIAQVQNSQQYKHPAYAYQRAPYQYTNVTYPENMSLIDPFKPELGHADKIRMLQRVARNLMAMPQTLGEPVSAPTNFWQAQLEAVLSLFGSKWEVPQWLVTIPITLIGCLVIGGIVLLWVRHEWFIPLYVISSVLVTCMSPWPEQLSRYITPLNPFLSLSLLYLLAKISEWRIRQVLGRYRKVSLTLTVMLLAIIFLSQGLTLTQSYIRGNRQVTYYDMNGNEVKSPLLFFDYRWEPVNTALEWLRRHCEPGQVIAATNPHVAYLRTGLKAVLLPLEADNERAQQLLDSVPVRYVVLDTLEKPGISERYAAPTIEKHPQLWKLIYLAPNGGARIYERVHQRLEQGRHD
ncbi:MAG: hypothetical protein L0226_05300 [Acidobacteria bacterium]|nr:hypothetical protein [Acidobacteriota bacterium]